LENALIITNAVLRILILITRGDSIGGAQTHVLALSKMLRNDGHDVLVCYGGKIEGPFDDLLNNNKITHVTIPDLKREISLIHDLRSIFQLRRLMRSYNPDIISLHSSKAGIIGRFSALFTKIPVIFTVHGWAFTDGVGHYKSMLYKFIERSLSPLATKIIVVSNYDQDIAMSNGIANKDKVLVIHNGIMTSLYSKNAYQSKEGTVVQACMIARFDQQKDHETLIRACTKIKNIKVHLLGDGPNLPNMISLAKELGIQEKFLFHGYSSKVNEILDESDIFLLISNWEGFPISTLEAMNFCLPVIVSDVGGAKEAVLEGKTGYLIKRKDSLELSQKLDILVKDAALRKSMGDEGKKLLIDKFSAESMYKKTLQIYLDVIKRRGL